MNSESGRRLSTEELKRLNQLSTTLVRTTPPDAPTRQDWENLLAVVSALYRLESTNSGRLERLEASVGPQEALLRALSRQMGQLPTQAQLEALARDVAQMRAELQQAGKKRERHFSLPKPHLPYIPWSSLLLGLMSLQLGKAVERGPDAAPVRDATTMHQHTDKKALRREKAKKIALGHKEDDHEEEPTWQQTMR